MHCMFCIGDKWQTAGIEGYPLETQLSQSESRQSTQGQRHVRYEQYGVTLPDKPQPSKEEICGAGT